MRLYHFLPTKWALGDIAKRHIKVSEIDQLNDPFELWCVSQSNEQIREELRKFKKAMAEKFGMICFCPQWSSPLLWSHYADKHRGICLGFDVDERGLKPVDYVAKRSDLHIPLTGKSIKQLLFTKFKDWQYEREWRKWYRLGERDGGHFFNPFDERIRLREVIAGPLCEVTEDQIKQALGNTDQVGIKKARLAFKTFRVVRMGWHFNTDISGAPQ